MKFSKQHLKYIIPVIVIIPLLWYLAQPAKEKTDNAYVQADITTVSAEINGIVKEINFIDNQYVKKDDILISLDSETYENHLAAAQDAHSIALLEQDKLTTNLELDQLSIDQAEAALESSQAELTKMKNDFSREEKLMHNKFSSLQQYEEIKTNLTKLQYKVKADTAALEKAKRNLHITQLELKKVKFNILNAEHTLHNAEKTMRNTVIKAPFTGYAANKAIALGDFVRAGSPLLAVVPEEIYIVANFKETQVAKMRPGQKVQIKLDALPGQKFLGEVETIAPASGALFSLLQPENATGNFTKIVQRFPVRIKFTDKVDTQLVRPGFSAVVHVYF